MFNDNKTDNFVSAGAGTAARLSILKSILVIFSPLKIYLYMFRPSRSEKYESPHYANFTFPLDLNQHGSIQSANSPAIGKVFP